MTSTSAEQIEAIRQSMQDEKATKDEVIRELVEALRPFALRAGHLSDTPDDFTAWHPAVGSPVRAGDLRRADDALRKAGAL